MKSYPYGSKNRELQRTAEMFSNLCQKGDFHLALWLVYDSNRYDTESLKFLCQRVEEFHSVSKKE